MPEHISQKNAIINFIDYVYPVIANTKMDDRFELDTIILTQMKARSFVGASFLYLFIYSVLPQKQTSHKYNKKNMALPGQKEE